MKQKVKIFTHKDSDTIEVKFKNRRIVVFSHKDGKGVQFEIHRLLEKDEPHEKKSADTKIILVGGVPRIRVSAIAFTHDAIQDMAYAYQVYLELKQKNTNENNSPNPSNPMLHCYDILRNGCPINDSFTSSKDHNKIECGFHSFTKKQVAQNYINDSHPGSQAQGSVIYHCTIPKGSHYYTGEFHSNGTVYPSIASNRIIINKLIK